MPKPAKLFSCNHVTGIAYCDSSREENGDYVLVAYLSYSTLELDVRKPKSALLPEIVADAATVQARRGERYQIAGNMSVTLGETH